VPTIKALCEQRGITMTELGIRCRLARPTISKINAGCMTTEKTLRSICRELGVEPGEIEGVQYYIKTIYGKEDMQ